MKYKNGKSLLINHTAKTTGWSKKQYPKQRQWKDKHT